MKRMLSVLLTMVVIFGLGCSKSKVAEETQKKLTFETEREKESYSVGFRTGITLYGMIKNNDIDMEPVLQGIKDAIANQSQLPEPEMKRIYTQFKNKLQKRQQKRQNALAYRNKVEGEQFLKENATREGVIVTESGLQYRVLREGTGAVPKETDIAVVHYRGILLNGMEVFNTYKRGKPVKLPVKRALPAWNQGLQLMKVGAKYQFFIPPDLAYKEHGRPPLIDANAILIYEAELLGIE